MREFAMHLTHKPGELGRIANVLGRAGVNLKAVAAMTIGNQGLVRLIPDDVETARNALQESNVRYEESEVIQVLLENQAGALAEIADKLANAGVNLHAAYVTGVEGNLVELALVPDDVKKAKKILE